MRPLIYHIALTLDGFIAHPDGSVDGFLMAGPHADDFEGSLSEFDLVLMGRKTYEFGYAFGLEPGVAPYPNMENQVFSSTLSFPQNSIVEVVSSSLFKHVSDLKNKPGKAIYLCGGGQLAGALLQLNLIDELWIKLNPISFGTGIPLFGSVEKQQKWQLFDTIAYANSVVLLKYKNKPTNVS